MKIDFTKLEVEVRIDEFQKQDVREALGNLLFSEAVTVSLDELARRIFNPTFPFPKDSLSVSAF